MTMSCVCSAAITNVTLLSVKLDRRMYNLDECMVAWKDLIRCTHLGTSRQTNIVADHPCGGPSLRESATTPDVPLSVLSVNADGQADRRGGCVVGCEDAV